MIFPEDETLVQDDLEQDLPDIEFSIAISSTDI